MGHRHELQVSVWQGGRPPGRPPVVMSECIGCGRIDRLRDCTGECRDVRVELVRADGTTTEAWECTACGRIESPQPCLGVCVRKQVEMSVRS